MLAESPAPSFLSPHGNRSDSDPLAMFDPHHDEWRDHQADRQKAILLDQVEQAKNQLLEQRARLIAQMHDPVEGEAALEELDASLRDLDALSSQIASAGVMQLIHLPAMVSNAIGEVRHQAAKAEALYAIESGLHITEMTVEHFQAIDRFHAAESARFWNYEQQSFGRMHELAARNGVDISGFVESRAGYQADYEEARRTGDRVGMARAEASMAYNNLHGLQAAGADEDELAQAREEAARARNRYMHQVERSALEAGQAQGLQGDALQAYVDQHTATEMEDFGVTA